MADEKGFEAFLHIVHISDLHFRHAQAPPSEAAERLVLAFADALRRKWPEKAQAIESTWELGTAGHDPRAQRRFVEFLREFVADKEFSGVETWLLDTGDVSSMGDAQSLEYGLERFEEYGKILGAKHMMGLYGNHDAWPGHFPATSPAGSIERHRKSFRDKVFKHRWPRGPLSTRIPGTTSKLQLYAVNSVIHDRTNNTLALGRVENDPHWEIAEAQSHQLSNLGHVVAEDLKRRRGARDFRVLAVHHPVHYPKPKPQWTMHLDNAADVATALNDFSKSGNGKLAHLILSGHTHELFPAKGQLPPDAVGDLLRPLTRGQSQLIAGSLLQAVRSSDRAYAKAKGLDFVPQQFQILTFWALPGEAGQVLIERRVFGRPAGTGDYVPIEPAETSEKVPSILIEC